MNNRGWSLQMMIGLCAILALALILSIIIFKEHFGNFIDAVNPFKDSSYQPGNSQVDETRTYTSMELEMIQASKKYVKKFYTSGLEEGDPLYVRVSSLQNEKFLKELLDVKDEGITCSGYVKALRKENVDTYKPYLKCGNNYTTGGYTSRFDG